MIRIGVSGGRGSATVTATNATTIPAGTPSVFARRTFEVGNPEAVESLVLRIDYDDGFVAYLNGALVASRNQPGGTIGYGTFAAGSHEAGDPERFDLTDDLDQLVAGTNVLAVIGLNVNGTSSDFSLHPELGIVPQIIHTNFELNRDGEQVILSDPSGDIVDAIVFPEQTQDHTFGRTESGGGEWKYFLTPTPGLANSGQSFDEPISSTVSVEPPAGVYSESIDVEISTTLAELTDVYYTLDGSEPTPNADLYDGPIRVTRPTVVRSAGFIGGERSTQISSTSYFVRTNIALPILSISMPPADYAAVHNNSSGRGRAWERAGHMEYFLPGGTREFATGFGLRLHGGAGRGGDFNTKKSYKVYFRGEYGDKKLDYPLIPTTEVEKFDKLVLRGAFNDSFRTNGRASYLRDELIRRLHEDMGGVISHGTFCVLYVNGRMRGVYNIVERMDEEFLGSYFGSEDWDVIKTGNDVLVGSIDEWNRIRSFAVNNDLANSARYDQFLEMIDIDNFTSYMIVNMWAQNHDWPHNNWYAARERVPDGKWIFMCWDAEFGIGLSPQGYNADTLSHTVGRNGYIRDIFANVLASPRYRELFIRALDQYSAVALSPQNVQRHLVSLRGVVESDIPEEMTQFGQTPEHWSNNVNTMMSFALNRTRAFTNIVENSAYNFPEVGSPVITGVSPDVVVNGGDQRVTFAGLRFTLTTELYVNGIPVPEVEFVRDSRLRVVFPYDERFLGEAAVRLVDTASGEESSYEGLIEFVDPVPEVVDILPSEGQASGGEPATVQGRFVFAGAEVYFGDEPAQVLRVDPETDEIDVFTPPGTGTVEVRIVNTQPSLFEGTVTAPFTYLGPSGTAFVRGDGNGDETVDISDAVNILDTLFLGDAELDCEAAADANSSTGVDLSDAVYILNFLFQGGDPIAAPYPTCGVVEDEDLPCENSPCA